MLMLWLGYAYVMIVFDYMIMVAAYVIWLAKDSNSNT
jgi:hypothetical protein